MDYYRIEQFAAGITNIKDIIDFEIKELRNLDIPDYLGIKLDSEIDQRMFENANTADDLSENVIDEIIEKVYDEVKGFSYGLWLGDNPERIKEMYGNSDVKDILSVYDIDKNKLKILSNLGSDGILFVSKEKLVPYKEIEL